MSPATYDPNFNPKIILWDPVNGYTDTYDLSDNNDYRRGYLYSYDNDRWDTGGLLAYGLSSPYGRFLAAAREGDEYTYTTTSVVTHPCMQNAGNASDPGTCASVCTDPGELFANWRTLLSCLTLASASLAANRLDWKNDTRRVGTGDFLESISGPGVNLTKLDGAAVLDATYQCAAASCSQNSMGTCNDTVESVAKKFFDGDSDNWSFLDETYCNSVQGSINVDVAGPGVIISYLLQSVLALSAWAIVMLLHVESTANLLARPYLYVLRRRRARHYTLSSLFPHAARRLHRIQDSNFMHATAAFLTEFHEAQCFFIFATSIALIYAQKQKAGFNGADNWQSLVDNQELVGNLGLSGAAPIILTQLTLDRLGMNSVYSLTCSTLSLVVAGVVLTQLREFGADRVHEMFSKTEGIDECGGYPSLRTFCVARSSAPDPTTASAAKIFPWLALLFVLWCVKIASMAARARGTYPGRARKQRLEEVFALSRRATATEWAKDIVPRVVKLAVLVAHGVIVALLYSNLDFIAMSRAHSGDEDGGWNVGQIIAMLIWVPVLAKYLYTVLFGMERGFAIRISNAFTILRKTDKDYDSSTNSESLQLRPAEAQTPKGGKYDHVDGTDGADGDVDGTTVDPRESV